MSNFEKLMIWLEVEQIDIKKLCWLLEYQSMLKEKGIIL